MMKSGMLVIRKRQINFPNPDVGLIIAWTGESNKIIPTLPESGLVLWRGERELMLEYEDELTVISVPDTKNHNKINHKRCK